MGIFMNRILKKLELAPEVKLFEINSPLIARKTLPGQFVVVRICEEGERIPLTIADTKEDTIVLVVQEVGKTTKHMGTLEEGYELSDVIGPLGKPTHIEKLGTVVCVGGGIGIAPIYPITKAMKNIGNKVISIIGARSKDLLIFEEKMKKVSDELYITTDDGSYGRKGFVTDELKGLIDESRNIDFVMAIGPVVMMYAVAEVTRPHNINTMVSLNPIMVDGTGMCGACRVEVGGKTRFTCVDGPDFDAHQVDFKLLMDRQRIYLKQEEESMRLFKRH